MKTAKVVRIAGAVALVGGIAACSSGPGGAAGITEADYRAAVQATADCMRADGWEVSEVAPAADGVTYGFTITASEATDDGIDAAYESCAGRHLNRIESQYLSGLELSGAERDAVYLEMIACLEAVGVETVSPGDDESTVTWKIDEAIALGGQDVDADGAWNCQQRYLFPLFGG